MDKLLEDLANVVEMIPDDWDWHKCKKCGELGLGNPWPELTHFIRTHHSTIRDMAARLEAAERDARRYRIIRLRLWPTEVQDALDMYPVDAALHMETCEDHARQIDAAIDAQHNSAREGE